jgi:hypothetical protein
MAAKTEESLISIAEKELAGFVQEKANAETALKEELTKAKSEYETLVKEIESKYNVSELTEKIKRHTYFTKLLKGEVSFPEDTEASRRKTKSTSAKPGEGKKWKDKFDAAYAILPKDAARKEVFIKVNELFPEVDITSKEGKNQINSALGGYKRAHNL